MKTSDWIDIAICVWMTVAAVSIVLLHAKGIIS